MDEVKNGTCRMEINEAYREEVLAAIEDLLDSGAKITGLKRHGLTHSPDDGEVCWRTVRIWYEFRV